MKDAKKFAPRTSFFQEGLKQDNKGEGVENFKKNCLKMSKNCLKMSKNAKKCQKMQKMSKNAKK